MQKGRVPGGVEGVSADSTPAGRAERRQAVSESASRPGRQLPIHRAVTGRKERTLGFPQPPYYRSGPGRPSTIPESIFSFFRGTPTHPRRRTSGTGSGSLSKPRTPSGRRSAASCARNEPARPPRRCRPHGSRRPPEDLPREPRHHQLAEVERVCPGCGQARLDIGVDRSEQLEYRPASLLVIEHFVHKYACPRCGQRQARRPSRSGPGHSLRAKAHPCRGRLCGRRSPWLW